MSVCTGCHSDDIYGSRKERRNKQDLHWLCLDCYRRLAGIALPEPEPRRRWDIFPPVAIVSAAAVLMSVILAVGAHW